MLWQWSTAGALALVWVWTARPWRDLGIAWPSGWGFAIALAATLAVLGYMAWQARSHALREVDAGDSASAAALEFIVPGTAAELRWVKYLCLSAGVVEELLFRGFLLWYLGASMPLWAAVGLSSVAFGIGHLYQGKANAFATAAMALVMAGLYVLSGSLWVPMLLHGFVNYIQLRMLYRAMR